MNPDHSPQFPLIGQSRRQWTRWGASLFIHVLVIALLLALPAAVHSTRAISQRHESISLIAPHISPKPLRAPLVRIIPIVTASIKTPVPKPVIVTEAPPLKPAAKFEAPKVESPRIEVPRIEAPAIEAARVPEVRPGLPGPALPPLRTAPPVVTGSFGGSAETSANMPGKNAVRNEVRTGGFGGGEGSGASARSTNGMAQVAMGAFEQMPGTNAAGRMAAAGKGGFDIPGSTQLTHAPKPTSGISTPVEITFKPKPAYTEEARSKGIEGEVQLEVRFCSTGNIEVLRVVRGLGYGLDESARLAAGQIRFRPGARDGTPVDMQGIVHIVFQRS